MQSAIITQVEKELWKAADNLRANSKLTASEYSIPVLGLIFLRFAYNRFLDAHRKIEQRFEKQSGPRKRQPMKDDYTAENAMYLPEKTRYSYLVNLSKGENIGNAINDAMRSIETEYPNLAGVLPKNYEIFEDNLLHDLLRSFNSDAINNLEGDKFGRIYEYFLNEFAISGAQEGGEFFTPMSLVQTIVNIIKPDHGTILDPAVGSAGMFIQTGHFLERLGIKPGEKITLYGQEKTATNTKIARMNLAVHGLEGQIAETNSFYNDFFSLAGKCDFVMANPPFNVNGVDKETDAVKKDPRLLSVKDESGNIVRLTPNSDNANYLWIQYFYGYLNETGRAGFVMASSASDAGYSERDIRKLIVNTGAVDVMVSIGTNFFYTRSLPCTLWFFDRAKESDPVKKDRTLMIDARSIYRVVTRKINDFSPEQLANITLIVDLYRGDRQAFITLLTSYSNQVETSLRAIPEAATLLADLLEEQANRTAMLTAPDKYDGLMSTINAFRNELAILTESISHYEPAAAEKSEGIDQKNKELRHAAGVLDKLVKQTQHAAALGTVAVNHLIELLQDTAGLFKSESNGKTVPAEWRQTAVKKVLNQVEERKAAVGELVQDAAYFFSQIHWLCHRFPDARYADVSGLCKVVTLKDIAENDFSLTPGRYVGVASKEDDDADFTERMRQIKEELEALNAEASALVDTISANFRELGI